jgi:hypothetical protein
MRLTLALVLLCVAAPAAAQEASRFNLECSEFTDPDTVRQVVDHEFSVDLDALTVCRRNNPRCAEVVRQGRFLELGYRVPDGDRTLEVFRLYDPQTGWLTQIMRYEGEIGRSYGDAVCKVTPFRTVTD